MAVVIVSIFLLNVGLILYKHIHNGNGQKSNKEIEALLFISYHTVKNHICNLYQKLGVKHRGELVHLAFEARKNTY